MQKAAMRLWNTNGWERDFTFCTRLKTHQRGERNELNKTKTKRCPTKLFSGCSRFFISLDRETMVLHVRKALSCAIRWLLIFIWHDFYGRVLDRLLVASPPRRIFRQGNAKNDSLSTCANNLPESHLMSPVDDKQKLFTAREFYANFQSLLQRPSCKRL